MPSTTEEDWSDSDSDIISDVKTFVNLGLPDGALQEESDLHDAAVSRLGGHPAFLLSVEPSLSCSKCENCSSLMELLLQIYCPFEDSPMDRALYVWGCSKPGCQGGSGSVRVWRGMRYNEEYAKKLENKLARKREAKAKATSEPAKGSKDHAANPFSMNAAPFAFGTQIFGDPPALNKQEEEGKGQSENESDDESISSEESLVTATTLDLAESPWKSAPSYPPIYLSTSAEYIPAKSKPKTVSKMSDGDEKDDLGTWVSEAYENSLDMDQVFDHFSKRVGYEGEQCIRYELNGVPLPFASDSVFEKLFPSPPEDPLPVTRGEFKVTSNRKRVYAPAIPECPNCKGKRVFECQLMPNLINVLRAKNDEEMSEEVRRKHVQMILKGGSEPGMTWGTCLIFSCKNDCCEGKEGWKEEFVLVQWDK